MARWKEPIRGLVIVDPHPHDWSTPLPKGYVEHETDVVLVGHQDGPWFCPAHRLYRHFADGVLADSHEAELNPGEDKWQERQSTPLSQ